MTSNNLDNTLPLLQTLQRLPLQQQQEIIDFLQSIVNKNDINPTPKKSRIAGLYQGEGWISEDFNEPLNDDFFTET